MNLKWKIRKPQNRLVIALLYAGVMAATLINSRAQTEENQIPGAESSIGKYHVTIPSTSSVVAYFSSVAPTHPVVPQKPNRYFPGLPMYQPLGAWVRNFGVPTHIGHRVAIFEFKWRDYTIQIWVAGKDKIVTEAQIFFTDQERKLSLEFVDAIAKSFGLAPVRASSDFRWYYGKKTDSVQVSVLDTADEMIDITASLYTSTSDNVVVIDNYFDFEQ